MTKSKTKSGEDSRKGRNLRREVTEGRKVDKKKRKKKKKKLKQKPRKHMMITAVKYQRATKTDELLGTP